MFLEIQVEHSQKVNKFFHRNLRVLAPFDDVIKCRVAGVESPKSNCKFCMIFRDLLFVSNTSYGSNFDEMREFFKAKITLQTFYMDFKNSQARQGSAFRHLWQMKKFGKNCLHFGSVQPVSLRALIDNTLCLYFCTVTINVFFRLSKR